MIINKARQRIVKVRPRMYMTGSGIFMDTLKALGRKAMHTIIPILKTKAINFAKEEIPKMISKKSQEIIKKLVKRKNNKNISLAENTPIRIPNLINEESKNIIDSLLRNDRMLLGEGLKLLS